MTRIHMALAAAAILAASCVSRLHAEGADDKGRQMCVKCHDGFDKNLAGKKPHKPVEERKCVACHNPHASNDKNFLDDVEGRLCARCHASVKDLPSRKYAHAPVKEQNCSACHDPHASNEAGLMKKPPAEACAECHKPPEVAADLIHLPVREGKCLACHDPHGSNEPGELKMPIVQLCLSCHKDTAALTKAHAGISIEKSNCGICHDAHGAGTKKLLRATVHYPVSQLQCGSCHVSATGDTSALTKQAPDLCFDCHKKDKFTNTTVHRPVADGKCLQCHNPHASEQKKLLRLPPTQLCFGCHKDIAELTRCKTVHKPFKEGECAKCHEPHASGFPRLARTTPGIELCETCHKRHDHPLGVVPSEKVKLVDGSKVQLDKNKRVVCLSCHMPHGSDFTNLTRYDKDRDLCVQCHSNR